MNRRALVLGMSVLIVAMAAGCANTARFVFRADPGINAGLLVPVDVNATTQAKAKELLKIGPDDWFTSDTRGSMSDAEIRHLALKPGEVRLIKFTGPKDADTFIVFADLKGVKDAQAESIVFNPTVGHRTLSIQIQGKTLVVLDPTKGK